MFEVVVLLCDATAVDHELIDLLATHAATALIEIGAVDAVLPLARISRSLLGGPHGAEPWPPAVIKSSDLGGRPSGQKEKR